MESIYIGNDHTITLSGLADSAGDPLLAATVSATLLMRDTLGEVPGETWPLTLSHQQDGEYVGTLDKAVQISKDIFYLLRVVAAQSGSDAQWDVPLVGRWRQE